MYEVRRDPIPGADVRQEAFGSPTIVFDWRIIQQDGKVLWACNPPEDARDIAEDWVNAEGLGKRWNGRIVEVDTPSALAVPESRRASLETLQTVFDAVNRLGDANKARILAGVMPTKEPDWAKPVPAAIKEHLKVAPWPEFWRLGEDGQPFVAERIVERLVEVERASAHIAEPLVKETTDAEPPGKDADSTSAALAEYGTPLKIGRAVAVIRARLAEIGDVELTLAQANHLLKKNDLQPANVKTYPALLQAAKE